LLQPWQKEHQNIRGGRKGEKGTLAGQAPCIESPWLDVDLQDRGPAEQRLVEVPKKWEPCRRRRCEWRAHRTRQAELTLRGRGDATRTQRRVRKSGGRKVSGEVRSMQIFLSLSCQGIRSQGLVGFSVLILLNTSSIHTSSGGK
jgi:hypothetical protein